MLQVRPILAGELDWYAALDPATPDLAGDLEALWDDGSGRAEWTLVAEDSGRPIGRAALVTEPFGCGLQIREGRLAGLWLDWSDRRYREAARALLDTAAELARHVTPFIERRLNPELHRDVDRWRAVLEAEGYGLFQEKAGFVWTDPGDELPTPARVELRTIAEIGRDAYSRAMGSTVGSTLDRNDRFYLDACGPDGWGREMVDSLEPGGEAGWLLASDPDGSLVGYVAVGTFERNVGTIVHIGVAPPKRGRGYVNELLRAANRAARTLGFETMLSDVDTENGPMVAAMERNGHRRGIRAWHVWAMRRDLHGPSR
jgi:ribosomal protein S18 acetylase RimI-like enzyme